MTWRMLGLGVALSVAAAFLWLVLVVAPCVSNFNLCPL
jgi:hypothetical protein